MRRVRRPLRLILIASAATVLTGVGATLAMNLWVRREAEPFVVADLAGLAPRDAAIVPGARVHPDGRPSAPLHDRLVTALDLYRAGKVRKILVSGDHAAPEYDEVNAMAHWLWQRGVPEPDVFLDHAGVRTLDTMVRAREVFLVRSALVCTQAVHMPRTVFLARRAGIDALGVVADRQRYLYETRNKMREFIATGVAFLDSYVFGTGPRHLGPVIPIAGDGRATHDRFTDRPATTK